MPAHKTSIPEAVENGKARDLGQRLSTVTRELAGLNRELASQMVLLASQTGDAAPLIGAVAALRKVQAFVETQDNPRDTGEVHQSLADTLFALGRANNDAMALTSAIASYRAAITMASLLGDDDWRHAIRADYDACCAALSARKNGSGDISALRVA